MVHNWAQFRYGVFTEHASRDLEGVSSNGEFYMNSRGEIEATRCSREIKGEIKRVSEAGVSSACTMFEPDGLPSRECVFQEELASSRDSWTPFGSLLYKPYLNQVKFQFTKTWL